ncbi:protein phosphatase 2C domain-containing protein [Butyrivibrio sp. VCD2006]|uniref:protein phosphatase 2C domain-containing protein n=1 Tax=Butyrivibrio sp. VCD2006 TaxID=1280664 RepID=UPI000401551F|nr:protein phosphatase 2C domain-containing protein [Butyrivibrio sp. VCD2006]
MNQDVKSVALGDYQIDIGGLSQIGVYKKVNQDAFAIGVVPEKQLAYVIVADGLGSCKHSDKGSARIVEIVENWIVYKLPEYAFMSNNVANILAKRMVQEWNASYDVEEISDYDSTVHFAVFYNGSLLIGGVGDGMALLSYDSFVCKDIVSGDDLFSNVTNSMCSINISELLSTEVVDKDNIKSKAIMILATDGIADDLIPEKKLTLPGYFQETIENDGVKALQNELEEWIGDWATENHSDDKTICYLSIEKRI